MSKSMIIGLAIAAVELVASAALIRKGLKGLNDVMDKEILDNAIEVECEVLN